MSVFDLAAVITAHSWSPDGTRVAVCENEPDVVIYSGCNSSDVSQWKKEFVLKRHTMVVTGIDWCPSTGKIVTCSHDVNAFVWSFDQKKNEWDCKVSILRIDRAAIRCKWSPDGSKFAVASGSKVASVSYFDAKQDWWVSKLTKKGQHKSTVLDVAWHPSSQLFATACCDFKCRVFSGYIPDVDRQGANTAFGSTDRTEFGQLMTEFQSTGAWIEAVAWSPSGNGLAFAGHDATISFVSFASGQPVCTTVKSDSLPYTRLLFLNENVVVGAGYNFKPEVYQASGPTQWACIGTVDSGVADGGSKKSKSKFGGSMAVFKNKDVTGTTEGSVAAHQSLHSNIITDMSPYNAGFSTSGSDGKIVVWTKDMIKKNSGAAI